MTLTSTTFVAAVGPTDQIVTLASVTGVSVDLLLVSGREAMQVIAVVDTSAVRVRRGVSGTPAIAHPAGATVYVGAVSDFYARDPIGVPPDPPLVTPWINLSTGAVWTVVSSAWSTTAPATLSAGDATQTTNIATATSSISTLEGAADGLGTLRVARATFDPSATAAERTVAAHGLGVTIPNGAVVVGGFVQVVTTFASTAGGTDKATIAISINGANDIISAVSIETGTSWDAGMHAIVPKANTPESTGILLTDAREITATVAVAALTAGKLIVFLYYVQGEYTAP